MENKKLISELNDMLMLENDAVRSYQAAIDNIDSDECRSRLLSFQGDHERHRAWIEERVREAGGKPKNRPDLKGPFLKGLTAIMSKTGDLNALRVMHQNENLTNSAYDKAVADGFPADVQAKWQEFQGDERRHRSWIVQKIAELQGEEAAPRQAEDDRPGTHP